MSRDSNLSLEDMRRPAEKVLRYPHGLDLRHFLDAEKTFDPVVRNLEIIGEAAQHIPPEMR